MSWEDVTFYAFPPFSILPRVLQKVRADKAQGVLIVPRWPTQVWWPVLTSLFLQAANTKSLQRLHQTLSGQPAAAKKLI